MSWGVLGFFCFAIGKLLLQCHNDFDTTDTKQSCYSFFHINCKVEFLGEIGIHENSVTGKVTSECIKCLLTFVSPDEFDIVFGQIIQRSGCQ